MCGFKKLHEAIKQCEWYPNINCRHVYFHLLLNCAGFDEQYGEKRKRGMLTTTFKEIAKENGITARQARYACQKLAETGIIQLTNLNRSVRIWVNLDFFSKNSVTETLVDTSVTMPVTNYIDKSLDYPKDKEEINIGSVTSSMTNDLSTIPDFRGSIVTEEGQLSLKGPKIVTETLVDTSVTMPMTKPFEQMGNYPVNNEENGDCSVTSSVTNDLSTIPDFDTPIVTEGSDFCHPSTRSIVEDKQVVDRELGTPKAFRAKPCYPEPFYDCSFDEWEYLQMEKDRLEAEQSYMAYQEEMNQQQTIEPEPNRKPRRKPKKRSDMTAKELERESDIDEVIAYLNEKAGTKFDPAEDESRRYIRARLGKKGISKADCFRVIDNKVAQWSGTKYACNLNPHSLFRNDRFPRYVGEASTASGGNPNKVSNRVLESDKQIAMILSKKPEDWTDEDFEGLDDFTIRGIKSGKII